SDARRFHPCSRGGTRRRLHLFGLSRRDGLPPDHRDPALSADGPLRTQGENRVTAKLAAAAGVLALASIPLWMCDPYVLHLLIMAGIFIIAAMSLNLLLGYAGQLSLGHVAFFGVGAYASALVSLGFSVHLAPGVVLAVDAKPVWLAMLAGMLAAGLCGWFIGRIAFKVRGAYFV